MRLRDQRFDTTFLGPVLVAALLVGAFGCIGAAALANASANEPSGVISVSEALQQMDQARSVADARIVVATIRR